MSSIVDDDDKISTLPDDILSTILTRLPLRDAGRTSMLARRWRGVWTTMPSLDLDWYSISNPGITYHNDTTCDTCRPTYMEIVEEVLGRYVDQVITSFRLNFCFEMAYAGDVDRCLNFAATKPLETLELQLRCNNLAWGRPPFTYDEGFTLTGSYLDRLSHLKHLDLHSCVLKVQSSFAFNKLVSLDLTYVLLEGTSWSSLLSKCSTVEWLKLKCCTLDQEVRIDNNSGSLRSLMIIYCKELVKLEVEARNLNMFEYLGSRAVELSIQNYPRVENVFVFLDDYSDGAAQLFSNLARDLPSVKSLSLGGEHPFINELPTHPATVFSSVVKLYYCMQNEYDGCFNLPSLLNSFPMLKKLHLEMPFMSRKRGTSPPAYLHTNLKEVVLSGFGVECLDFADFFNRSCTTLERLVLTNRSFLYKGCGLRQEFGGESPCFKEEHLQLFNDKLRGKSLSTSANIIYQ